MATQAALLQIQVDAATGKARRELQAFDKRLKAVDASAQSSSKSIDKFGRDTDRASRPVDSVSGKLLNLNQAFLSVGNAAKTLKLPVLVSAVGPAAQGVSALAAGTTALVGALIPAAGAATGAAAAYGAMGQAAGVIALSGVGDLGAAVGGLNEKMDRSADAFKALSPEAQKFAGVLEETKAPLLDIQAAVQKPLFSGMNKGLVEARKNLPALKTVMRGTAQVMGDLAKRAGEFVGRKAFGKDFTRIGQGNTKVLDRMGRVGFHLADAFRHVMVEAQPLINWMTKAVVRFSEYVEQSAKAGRESGDLAEFFDETRRILAIVVPAVGDLAKGLWNVLRAGTDLGTDVWRKLADIAEEFRDWTESAKGENAIEQWFEDAKKPLWELGRLIRDVGKEFGGLAEGEGGKGITGLLKKIRKDLLPAVSKIFNKTDGFATVFVDFATEGAQALGPFIGPSGPLTVLVKAMTGLLRIFNDLIEAVPVLGTALVTMAGMRSVNNLLSLFGFLGGGKGGKGAKGGMGIFGGGMLGGTSGKAPKTTLGGKLGGFGKFLGTGSLLMGGMGALGDPGQMGLTGRFRNALSAASFGLFQSATEEQAEHLRNFKEEIKKSTGNLWELHRIQELMIPTGVEAGNISEDQAKALQKLTVAAIQKTEVTENALKANLSLDEVEHGWSKKLRNMADVSNKELDRISDLLREKPRKGVDAFAAAMDDMVKSIRQAMKDGEISTRKGNKRIHSILIDQLGAYGISHGGAQKIIKAREDGGQGGFQRGGPIDQGRPSGDSVPAMLERGEYVLNRNAVGKVGKRNLDALNFSAAKRFARGGGVGGLNFALGPETVPPIQYDPDHAGGNSHWHITGTSTPWVVGIGRQLQRMGFMVGEHPAFGGVTAQHSATGGHYDALAIDVNSAADETHAETVRVAALLGGAGGAAAARLKLKLPRFDSPFSMFTPAARGLNQTARGLEKIIPKRVNASQAASVTSGVSGGSFSKGQLASLWSQTGGNGNANLMAAIALAESGGNPNADNGIARGLWQIISSTWSAYGKGGWDNAFDPTMNAKAAHAILAGGGLTQWDAYTNGAYSSFLQRGGIAGMKKGGSPGKEQEFSGHSQKAEKRWKHLRKALPRMAKRIAKTDERLSIAQTMAGLATSPGGSELAGTEKKQQLRILDNLMGQLHVQARLSREGVRVSKAIKKPTGTFREALIEMVGLTGKGGRIFDTSVARSELRSTPLAGMAGISISDLLRIRDASQLGLLNNLPTFHGGGTVGGPVGKPQPIMAKGGEVVSPGGDSYFDIYIGGEKIAEHVRAELRGANRQTNLRARAGVRMR